MRYLALLLAVPVFLCWLSAGYWTLRSLRLLQQSRRHLFFATMMGFGVVGNLITLLGLTHTLSRMTVSLLVASLCVAGLFGPLQYLVRTARFRVRAITNPYALGCGLFVAIFLVRGLLPPTGIDALMYHLPVPKLYLEHGGFHHIPWNGQSDFPMLGEMNFLIGIAFGNPVLCRLIAFATGLFACGMVLLLSIDLLRDRRLLALPLLIFLAHTNTTAGFSGCNVDLLAAAFALAAFWWLRHAPHDTNRPALLPATAFLCFTLQSKPFGVLVLPPVLIYELVMMRRDRSITWRAVVLSMLVPIAAGCVWYLKSIAFTGAPMPGLHTISLTGTTGVSTTTGILHPALGRLILLARNIVTAPWSYSLLPLMHRFDCFGPLFVGILPLALFVKRDRYFNDTLLWAVSVWVMFILLSTARGRHGGLSIRYMTASVALFSVLVVYVLQGYSGARVVRNVLSGSILLAVCLSLVVTVKRYRTDIAAVLGNRSWHQYLSDNYPLFPAIDYANRHLPDDCLVEASYCFGTYYMDKPYRCQTERFGDFAEMLESYRTRGVTHLITTNTLNPETNRHAWFCGKGLDLLFRSGDYYLYEVPKVRQNAASLADTTAETAGGE